MSLKKCPVCGEKYSDTYKNCPFCEEEETLRSGAPSRRRSGGRKGGSRRGGRAQEPNILSPMLVIVLLVLIALLFYFFFGEQLLHSMGLDRSDPVSSSSQEEITPTPPDTSGGEGGAVTMPGGEDDPSPADPSGNEIDTTNLPETLTLSNPDFTLTAGESYVVKVLDGGSGYTWFSSDDGVASVDADGKVTAISSGKITLTVTDGKGKGTGVVYVKGGSAGSSGSSGSSGTLSLNRDDFTLPVGETFVLEVSGAASSNVAWDVANDEIASVSDTGAVRGKSVGTTTVTAVVNGKTLHCTVRVK